MIATFGVATIDITPPLGIELDGYHRPTPSSSVLDRLSATALVVTTDTTRAVVVSVDNCGMLPAHVDEARQRISKALDLAVSQIMVLFTHTHSGPVTFDTTTLGAAYRHILTAHLVQVAQEAALDQRPCHIAWGVTHARIGVNRRVDGPDGKARMGTNLKGPVDDRVGVVTFSNPQSNEPLGLLVLCTAHANVLKADSTCISGDFPGWARQLLSRALDCPVLIAIGAAGDINARWRGSVGDLRRMAQELGGAVLRLLPELDPQPLAHLWIGSSLTPIDLMEVPEPEKARAIAEEAMAWGVDTQPWLQRMQDLYALGMRQLSLDVEVQLLRLGDGFLAGVPMEPFSAAALEVRHRIGLETAFLGGYTNGVFGYLPTAEELPRGGYEVNWMPVVYGPDTGYLMPVQAHAAARIIEEVVQLSQAAGMVPA